MATVRVACTNPNCGASFSVAESHLGRRARCKKCGRPFELTTISDVGKLGDDVPMVETPLVGSTFADRYLIERALGEGGMGSVFLAKDLELGRRVALKVPHFDPGQDAGLIKRFKREARVAASFDHPYLFQVFYVGESGGAFYITMPFIEGETLADQIKKGLVMPSAAIAIVQAIAAGLAEAHRKGVTHRDLKPANILMKRGKTPIVVDFGLAKHDDPEDSLRTKSGAIMGSPHYMAPEQVNGQNQLIGPRSDIYSLGVILYELLTGTKPFRGSTASVLVQIVGDAPKPPSKLRARLDPKLDAIVLKAMAKDPAARYSTINSFSIALKSVDSAELTESATKSVAKSRWSNKRPSFATWIVGIVIAAVLLLAAGVILKITTDQGTVTLDIADPDSVGVILIDGSEIALDVLGESLKLQAGEHELKVTRRDLIVQTRQFSIQRGVETVVTVDYEPNDPGVETPASTVNTTPEITIPPDEPDREEVLQRPVIQSGPLNAPASLSPR